MAKLLKIYELPKRWIALYEGERFNSWTKPISVKKNETIEDVINLAKDPILQDFAGLIDYSLDQMFGRQARECWDGKHEDCYVWRAEGGEKTSIPKCTCNILLGCTCEAGRAELEKERLSNG